MFAVDGSNGLTNNLAGDPMELTIHRITDQLWVIVGGVWWRKALRRSAQRTWRFASTPRACRSCLSLSVARGLSHPGG
jgi:formate-dependent nitrite reductase cytochrome c552 subunit